MKYANDVNILYVEDDSNLAYVTKDNLERSGLKMILCTDGESAYNKFLTTHFHLCLIDIMLPRLDGISLIKKIRKINEGIPIVVLSAKSMLEDRMEGFKTGADDYLIKPYSIDELLYKINVFLKRSHVTIKPGIEATGITYTIGKYEFDFNELTLKDNTGTKNLTLREAELLRLFCQNKNMVVRRNMIMENVWKNDENYTGRSIDVFVSKLRRYLKNDVSIRIETVRSFGYKLCIS